MNAKSLIASRTFWIAVVQAAIAVVIVFDTQYPNIGILLMAKSVLDIVLRVITTATIGGIVSGSDE